MSGADNSIQDVPVYITVACFLVSEGASLDAVSHEGLTPFGLCPAKYRSLLKIFARPERYYMCSEPQLHVAESLRPGSTYHVLHCLL